MARRVGILLTLCLATAACSGGFFQDFAERGEWDADRLDQIVVRQEVDTDPWFFGVRPVPLEALAAQSNGNPESPCGAEDFDAALFETTEPLSVFADGAFRATDAFGGRANLTWHANQHVIVMDSGKQAWEAAEALSELMECSFEEGAEAFEPDPELVDALSEWYQIDRKEIEVDGASRAFVVDYAHADHNRVRYAVAAIDEVLVIVTNFHLNSFPRDHRRTLAYETAAGRYPDLLALSESTGTEIVPEIEMGPSDIGEVTPDVELFFEIAVRNFRNSS